MFISALVVYQLAQPSNKGVIQMSKIRKMTEQDRAEVYSMMEVFYASDAVFTNGSDEIFTADIDACVSDSPYLVGYVFEEDGIIQGYAMLAKSFSTEFGKRCIWIEDIYLKEEYRSRGIATDFFAFIEREYENSIFRLEAERENEKALHVYEKCGFGVLSYVELKK